MEKQIPALYKTIGPEMMRNVNHAIIVPAWASFVEYLIGKYGMDNFKLLYTATDKISEVEPFSEAFMNVYGIGFQEADRAWRLDMLRYEGDAAADTLPDPGESGLGQDRK
jgi:hypothetical protein